MATGNPVRGLLFLIASSTEGDLSVRFADVSTHERTGRRGPVTKSDREIMEIFEAYDLTETVWSAAALTGHDPKTVKRYVEARAGGATHTSASRGRR